MRGWLAPAGKGAPDVAADATPEQKDAPVETVVLAAAAVPVMPEAVPEARNEEASSRADAEEKPPEPRKKAARKATARASAKTGKARKRDAVDNSEARVAEATPQAKKPARKKASPSEEQAPAPETGAPALLADAREGRADDLKKIKGIGPKLEGTLNALGIFHYDQIAAWGPTEMAWVDDKLSFHGRIAREAWVEQAKALASGG